MLKKHENIWRIKNKNYGRIKLEKHPNRLHVGTARLSAHHTLLMHDNKDC